jgi:hypothetical protein
MEEALGRPVKPLFLMRDGTCRSGLPNLFGADKGAPVELSGSPPGVPASPRPA